MGEMYNLQPKRKKAACSQRSDGHLSLFPFGKLEVAAPYRKLENAFVIFELTIEHNGKSSKAAAENEIVKNICSENKFKYCRSNQ